jgi:hypothetical protein
MIIAKPFIVLMYESGILMSVVNRFERTAKLCFFRHTKNLRFIF